MSFHREYLVRLPLPLAQLYSRAHNAKDARGRHDNSFYLLEAHVKLTVAPLAAAYLREVSQGAKRTAALDRLLAQLSLPSLGQWVAMLRELARHFGTRADAASHPLGHLWLQLDAKRRDLPAALALYQRIKNGPDGQPAGDQSVSLLALLDALVQYRNAVFGHGGPRFASFYEQEMGPLLFPAADELLAEETCQWLGPRGTRLVYLTELRGLDEQRFELGLKELIGLEAERSAPVKVQAAQAAEMAPNRIGILWPGHALPVPLDPLLVYRETELSEEVLFLNRELQGRQVQYLSYTTGRTERDKTMGDAMARLLSQITGREISSEELERLQEQSVAETPSVEALFEPVTTKGRVVGDYEILTQIGRGGMGVVYLARQLSLGRIVALKMLPADLAGDEVALARFRREMRALARCDHPHIVKVLASGTLPDGQWFYAMEYVPGADLEHVWRELSKTNGEVNASTLGSTTWARAVLSASRKQREQTTRATTGDPTDAANSDGTQADPPGDVDASAKPLLPQLTSSWKKNSAAYLPPLPELPDAADDPGGYSRRVALLMRDAALSLQAVHEQRVVHRDVKPANLMLTPDGQRVVLMDFGLAKGGSLALTASRAGGFLGTLRYAAPEQLAAATVPVGPPADIRGLGVVLWELLTRKRLFSEAEDEKQLAQWILHRDVPLLRAIDPTLDRDLEAIVARATERSTSDRIASANDLANYLQLYVDDQPLPIRPPGLGELTKRWVRQHAAVVATAAVAAAVGVIMTIIAFALINATKNEAVAAKDEAQRLAAEKSELAESEKKARQQAEQLAKENAHNAMAARDAWQQGLDIAQRLAKADPTNAQAQRDLSVAYDRLGDVSLRLGDAAAARDAYQQAFEIRQWLAKNDPTNAQAQRDLSVAYDRLGDVNLQLGNVAAARDAYQQKLGIARRLVQADSKNAEAQRDLWISVIRVGDANLKLGNVEDARNSFQHSTEISYRLFEADPTNAQAQREVWISRNKLGDANLQLGNVIAARDAYQRALEVVQKMAEVDPNNAQVQRDLSFSCNKLGDANLQFGNVTAARDAYQRGLEIVQRLAHPANALAQLDLSISQYKLATSYQREEKWEEALRRYAAALEILQTLKASGRLPQSHEELVPTIETEMEKCRAALKGQSAASPASEKPDPDTKP